MKQVLFGAAVAAGMFVGGSAQAVVVSILAPGVLTTGGSEIDFNAPVMPNGTLFGTQVFSGITAGTITFSGDGRLYTGTVSGVSARPAGDTTQYMTVLKNKSETIEFSVDQRYFGLLWGSLDTHNSIQFYNDGTLVQSYTGTQIATLTGLVANGNQFNASSNRYLRFTFAAPEAFDKVRLSSTGNSFEFDNISAAVPEPSTWAMMLIGFAGLAYAARRRRQTLVA